MDEGRCRETNGASNLPGGADYYREALKWHTSEDMTPEKAHELGLEEVERITGEMKKVWWRFNDWSFGWSNTSDSLTPLPSITAYTVIDRHNLSLTLSPLSHSTSIAPLFLLPLLLFLLHVSPHNKWITNAWFDTRIHSISISYGWCYGRYCVTLGIGTNPETVWCHTPLHNTELLIVVNHQTKEMILLVLL